MQMPKILDCTLRDGSYAIRFQFTAEDTSLIAAALDEAGIPFIEVGHGVGLGASERGFEVAAEQDEVYMQAAANSVRHNRWGMFCIPGIARLEHVELAASYKMDFIRIGSNLADVESTRPYIECAKKHGMYVAANFMKSYSSPPEVFLEKVRLSVSYGADLVYLVDSAGGMLPEEIRHYITTVKDALPQVGLGFHGHNNLGLGVANALVANELGVEVVDASLQGIGRGGGNTCLEQYVCALQRSGLPTKLDPVYLMTIARKYVAPKMSHPGPLSLDVVSGLALFHSSYMPIIEKYALRYRVDPHKLIIAVCEKNRTSAPEALVEEEARHLAEAGIRSNGLQFAPYYGQEQD
ncbi:MAG: 4-hydroxy-2-oxovalerate aldolase [Magnetococcales bacterium]|nr:4-hydroxy-2-oxovalerate aldolase [Magnetococcales bacterium]NGZ28811.1 4-hydroxy-2-oxovalerate aldolase [Magnetococcales bacterium]